MASPAIIRLNLLPSLSLKNRPLRPRGMCHQPFKDSKIVNTIISWSVCHFQALPPWSNISHCSPAKGSSQINSDHTHKYKTWLERLVDQAYFFSSSLTENVFITFRLEACTIKLTNIILCQKLQQGTNTLAYLVSSSLTKKVFITFRLKTLTIYTLWPCLQTLYCARNVCKEQTLQLTSSRLH